MADEISTDRDPSPADLAWRNLVRRNLRWLLKELDLAKVGKETASDEAEAPCGEG